MSRSSQSSTQVALSRHQRRGPQRQGYAQGTRASSLAQGSLCASLYMLFYVSLCVSFCTIFGACEDPPVAVDLGAPEGGEATNAGVDEGMPGGGAVFEGCITDNECASGQYCDLGSDALRGTCAEGCRAEPDSCATPQSRKRCDIETRQCVLTCEEDTDCYDDQYCSSGVCEEGCRVASADTPSSCAPQDGAPQLCDTETRSCIPAGVCCDLDDVCSVSTPSACTQVGGEILLGILSCEPDPCTTLCSRDTQCAANEYCSDYGRCVIGCRLDTQGGCPADLTCDAEERRCVSVDCESDDTCPEWQYCGADGQCADGCRADGCEGSLRCDDDHVCRALCVDDAECGADERCDVERGRCVERCDPASQMGCALGERCVEGACVVGCADDIYEVEGDDSRDDAPLIEWASGAPGEARSSGPMARVLCVDQNVSEEDWSRLTLAAGERVEVRVSARPSSGPIEVALVNTRGEVLAVSDPWAREQALRYPERGADIGGAEAGDYWVVARDAGAVEPHPYTLEVNVGPLPSSCFSDRDDPIDNTVNGARLIGLEPTLRFTDEAEGDVCEGDRDHFCFPMSLSDGLDLYVEAPASCDPLLVRLAPSSSYTLSPIEFAGYTLTERERPEGASDDAPREYLIELDPETSAFSNDEWCAQVSSEGSCEGYRLSATFSRRQLVCSDLREPNNTLPQATPLDGVGPLGDGAGQIAYQTPATLNENLVLCPGDVDLFSVSSSGGDAWRAWITDDSDPADDPLRGRGQLVGELRVRFVNAEGVPVGDSAPVNARDLMEGAAIQFATAVSAVDEPLYIEVSGEDDSAGPYLLHLERIPSDGECSQDVNEPDGRDDELNPVSQLRPEGGRLTVNNGYLCDPEGTYDEDWFTFDVAESNTRLCLNSTFRHRDGDINVELFEAGDGNVGELCAEHVDCRADQSGSSCINRRCRAPVARANSLDDGEMIHFSSLETQAGRYYARIYSPEPIENAYQLGVTLVPPIQGCDPDPHEGSTGNNRAQDATRFGSGRVELCDSWVCADERAEGDWYEIVVPASAQRTIHVSFETQQGRLTLSANETNALDGRFVESPRSQSRNVHCINVAAGIRPATVRLHVSGDVFNIGQTRVDYILRVVPTNLTTSTRGSCDILSGGLFGDVEWPLLNLD